MSVSWQLLWEALAVDVLDPNVGAMSSLGLRGRRVGFKNDPASNYHEERHGRWLQIRQADVGHGRMQTVTWVGAAAPPFEIVADGDRMIGRVAPPSVAMMLGALARSRVWADVDVRGGDSGIVARRMVKPTQPQSWMYDLWLVEAIAGTPLARPLAAPASDPAEWTLPG